MYIFRNNVFAAIQLTAERDDVLSADSAQFLLQVWHDRNPFLSSAEAFLAWDKVTRFLTKEEENRMKEVDFTFALWATENSSRKSCKTRPKLQVRFKFKLWRGVKDVRKKLRRVN